MNESLLLRLLILGALVGGGVLFALAGMAFDRWRERRARARSARQNAIAAAKYPANLTHLYRWRERRAHLSSPRERGAIERRYAGGLTNVTTPRSSA